MYTMHVHSRIWCSDFCVDHKMYFIIFRYLLPIVPGRIRWCYFTERQNFGILKSIEEFTALVLTTARYSQGNFNLIIYKFYSSLGNKVVNMIETKPWCDSFVKLGRHASHSELYWFWRSQVKVEGQDGHNWQMWDVWGCYAFRCYICCCHCCRHQ